ncbi:MAG: hypothetical protein HZA77_13790 [Candidatus Schekmanbacteria bacterium]|nr:hypothetical protein [Candidatus Schekmanbacteria bacterium]
MTYRRQKHFTLTVVVLFAVIFTAGVYAKNSAKPFMALADNEISFESATTDLESVALDPGNLKNKKVSDINPDPLTPFSSEALPKIHIKMEPIKTAAKKAAVTFSFLVTSSTNKKFRGIINNVKIGIKDGTPNLAVPIDTGNKESVKYIYRSPTGTIRKITGHITNDSTGPLLKSGTDELTFDISVFKDKILKSLSSWGVKDKTFSGTYTYTISLSGTSLGIEVDENTYKPAQIFEGQITFN